MAKWIRLLSRPADASSKWHFLAVEKEFASANALCGERFAGPVEAATGEDVTERDGRCPDCEARLAAKQSEAVASR
jgi:uncharacterized protein with PIN domain